MISHSSLWCRIISTRRNRIWTSFRSRESLVSFPFHDRDVAFPMNVSISISKYSHFDDHSYLHTSSIKFSWCLKHFSGCLYLSDGACFVDSDYGADYSLPLCLSFSLLWPLLSCNKQCGFASFFSKFPFSLFWVLLSLPKKQKKKNKLDQSNVKYPFLTVPLPPFQSLLCFLTNFQLPNKK